MATTLFEEVAALFHPSATRDEYGREFTALLAERLPVEFCAVALCSAGPLAVTYAAGKNGARHLAQSAIGHAPPSDRFADGEPVAVESTLFLPIAPGPKFDGVVVLKRERRPFDAATVRELRACVHVFTLALQNAELADEVEHLIERSTDDCLTGAHNRRGFDERLRTDWKRAMRDGSSIALALIDVDHMREYDESYGATRRDECLRQVARAIAAAGLRSGDYVARFGAHEFAVVLPGADEEGALALCERIRRFVELRGIEHAPSPHGIVTVSIGVASTTPSAERTPWSLVAQTDANLAHARHAGRNRVAGTNALRGGPLADARPSLPPAARPFLGRAAELQALAEIDSAWITITGPPGIGKTELALEFARRSGCGATFVDLRTADGNQVGTRIDDALRSGRHHERTLLILDHCELPLAAIADYATGERDAGQIRIVATCDVPLNVRGEATFALGPLGDDDAALFFERIAGQPDGTFAALLGGVPFALEFVALAIAGEPGAAAARLMTSDETVGRAVRVAEFLSRCDVPHATRVRVMAAAAHTAAVTGDLIAFDRLLDWLVANVDPADDGLDHIVAALECVRRAHFCIAGDDALSNVAEVCSRELARARRAGHDMLHEMTLAQAVVARRSDRRDVARSGFDRVLREIRSGAAPYLMPLASVECATFLLGTHNADEALSLLLDATRFVRRVPMAGPAASALDAYVYAGGLRDNLDAAARLHAFVTAYRRDRSRPRSPASQELYAAVLDRYGLPPEPPEPDLAGVTDAFDLALSI